MQNNNPLHGLTLELILMQLEAEYGFRELGQLIPIRCFNWTPSIKSSLTFLRKTEWARLKVEELYLNTDFDPQTFEEVQETYLLNKKNKLKRVKLENTQAMEEPSQSGIAEK
jgi:uncharacterized protein (DUF2132 family)